MGGAEDGAAAGLPDTGSIRAVAAAHGISLSESEAGLVQDGFARASSALSALRARSYDPTAGGLDVAKSDGWLRDYRLPPRPWLGPSWPSES